MPEYKKKCAICGCDFVANRSNQVYCSECGKNPNTSRKHYASAVARNRYHAGEFQPKPRYVPCINCGEIFPSVRNRKICSAECERDYFAKTAKCQICGKPLDECGMTVSDVPSFWGKNPIMFCSPECKEVALINRARAEGRYEPCENCGKRFLHKQKTTRFCSRECYHENLEKVKAGLVQPAKSPKTIKCKNCGRIFNVEDAEGYKTENGWCCSMNCLKADQSRERKLKKHRAG